MARLGRIVCMVMLFMHCRGSAFSKVQICGAHLAEAIRVVCSGRGYNVAFGPDGNAGGSRSSYRRYKRGIVDECCRQGCSIGTLESYCSAPSTQNPNNLQIRKRSEITPRKTVDIDETAEFKQIRESLKHLKFTNEVYDPHGKRISESFDVTNDETLPHLRRRLFGHSSGELKMRHPNRYFNLGDDLRHHGQQYKYANKHRENTVANKVKRNDVSKKDSEALDSEYSEFSYLPLSGVKDAFSSDDFLTEAAPAGDELNLILNRNSETTPHPTLIRHHRDRFIQKGKKQKNDPRNKKAKIDEAGESGAASQIGTIAPYFSGHTLVSPSSRKGFIPHL